MKIFNTAGPVIPEDHYCIPPLERVDLNQLRELVRDKKCFLLHAPRQSGKTSTLLAFRDYLNSGAAGKYRCVYAVVQGANTAGEDIADAIDTILGELAQEAKNTLNDDFLMENWRDILSQFSPNGALKAALSRWAESDSRPLVLLIDEIDSLVGASLKAVLIQLNIGYQDRPKGFPQSIMLCGMRNLKNYHLFADEDDTGSSIFNAQTESLRLGDFSRDDVHELLAQHTEETGQEYAPEAVEAIWKYTQGQPWLVNALATELCKLRKEDNAQTNAFTMRDVLEAKKSLILRRDTHLYQLGDRLKNPRVRRIIEPMLIGADDHWGSARDEEYVRDLGLITEEGPPRIANPIYMDVIPRELTHVLQSGLVARDPVNCINPDGSLNTHKLLEGFQEFFRRNVEHWRGRFDHDESGAQLILQGYAQGKINGRGRVEREYGLGRRRVDLMIFWRDGEKETGIVIECKMLRDSLEQTLREGLPQTADYMDIGAANEGHLVIFDRSEGRDWEEKIYHREETHEGRTIEVWGM